MLFSSISFLYYFLPVFLGVYFIVPKKYKNIVLLIFSLIFYFYGEGTLTLILILSCFINYLFGIYIGKNKKISTRKTYLILGLIFNIGLLMYFKYTNFFISTINDILNLNIKFLNIVMPLGISFFTFQSISYLVDVYRKEVEYSKSFFNLATYITLFPQLVAGPIVKYKTIKDELIKKDLSIANFSYGVKRFIIGLSKKVILANNLGLAVELLKTSEVTRVSSWLIAIYFTLQIYFDFSGYSDMAIGLGKILGFNFLENFNYPYIAKSITDFWRRWHISLSSFFRDYLYIPLGGNRCSKLKWIRNILVVWLLTGFWHGANYNFIIWGLYFGLILLIEKLFLKKYLENKKIINHIYVIFVVIISFVIFNSNSLSEVIINLKNMLFFNNIPLINNETIYYFRSYIVLLIISIIGVTPLLKNLKERIIKNKKIKIIVDIFETIIIFTLLIISTSYLVDSSFNPFLYFRF